jgi:hypothetical protein
LLDHYRAADRMVTQFVRSLDRIGPESTLLPLLFEKQPPGALFSLYSHLADYAALEKRAVDLTNYEPPAGYFPIGFHRDVAPLPLYAISAMPQELKIAPLAGRAQYIFTWHMRANTPIERRIEQHYRLVSSAGAGRVYRSFILEPSSVARLPMILLPAADSAGQGVRNDTPSAVHLILSTCATACEFDLAPGQQMPLASTDPEMPFIVVYAPRSAEKALTFTGVAAVSEESFQRRKMRIENVSVAASRLNLRVWFFGRGPRLFTIRIRSRDGSRGLMEKTYEIPPVGFFTIADLTSEFSLSGREPVDVEIDVNSDDVRLWAMIRSRR